MFLPFLDHHFFTLLTLPTQVQTSFCLYFSTMIMQRSSWIHVLVRTHHIKITYIVTSGNLPSFSASYATVFLYFMDADIVSRYLITPRCQLYVILSTFLCPYSDYHSTSHTSTSTPLNPHITHTCAKFLPNQSPNKWRTYICSIIRTSYVFVAHFLDSKFLCSFSLTLNPVFENSILHGTSHYTS